MEEIPPELILKWDQTGLKIVPSSSWTMDQRSVNQVEMIGVDDSDKHKQDTTQHCDLVLLLYLLSCVIAKFHSQGH